MTSRKKLVLQAIGLSLGLACVGIIVNVMGTATMSEQAMMVDEVLDEAQVLGADQPMVRAREEHGEIITGSGTARPATEDELSALGYVAPPSMDRAAAIRRAEDLVEKRDNPRASVEEREQADRKLSEHLAENFPPAASDGPIGSSSPEPKNGDSHVLADLDINNVFNKVWGLLQALIVAWATYKFQSSKKKERQS